MHLQMDFGEPLLEAGDEQGDQIGVDGRQGADHQAAAFGSEQLVDHLGGLIQFPESSLCVHLETIRLPGLRPPFVPGGQTDGYPIPVRGRRSESTVRAVRHAPVLRPD